jgi:hypothetical protein
MFVSPRQSAAEKDMAIRHGLENKVALKKKKDQLALALDNTDFPAIGPIPTIPGGWGLRNPKPKGPGQRSNFLSQPRRASGWRKWGGIMILLTIP